MSFCKLYPDILDNIHFGLLPDHLWRRIIEMYIISIKEDNNGLLPELSYICWELHLPHTEKYIEALKADLDQLVQERLLSIKEVDNEKYYAVRNFHKLRPKTTSYERVQKYRERRQKNGLDNSPGYDPEAIKRRDDYKCVYCGSGESLCVDHIYPILQGGTDNYDNLACACNKCNSGKGGRTPEEAGLTFINKVAEERYQRFLATML